jgi:predicted pyridoxine 5'-phosphate oxidase superfamily flavin-nucleotide-binding protein
MPNDSAILRHRFHDIVTSEEELRAVVGHPPKRSVDKVVRIIDEHSRRFIAQAPFVFVASAGPQDMLDISPKGDPAGFVKVIDDRTLAIPDRLGNRRLDTFRNVLGNPNVGLIFLIPGITYTLRVLPPCSSRLIGKRGFNPAARRRGDRRLDRRPAVTGSPPRSGALRRRAGRPPLQAGFRSKVSSSTQQQSQFSNKTSTRRFAVRPSSVALDAMGCSSPLPSIDRRVWSISKFSTRNSLIASARCVARY